MHKITAHLRWRGKVWVVHSWRTSVGIRRRGHWMTIRWISRRCYNSSNWLWLNKVAVECRLRRQGGLSNATRRWVHVRGSGLIARRAVLRHISLLLLLCLRPLVAWVCWLAPLCHASSVKWWALGNSQTGMHPHENSYCLKDKLNDP